MGKVQSYLSAINRLKLAGRIKPTKKSSIKESYDAANRLISKGYSEKITKIDVSSYIFEVPSEFTHGVSYKVYPAECRCSCPYGEKGFFCKHLQLFMILGRSSDSRFTSVENQINNHVEILKSKNLYSSLDTDLCEYKVQSLFDREFYFVSVSTNSCTCVAHGYYPECSCLRLTRSISPTIAPSIPEVEDDEISNSEHLEEDSLMVPNAIDEKASLMNKLSNIQDKLSKSEVISEEIFKMVDILDNAVSLNVRQNPSSATNSIRNKIKPLNPKRKTKKRAVCVFNPASSPSKVESVERGKLDSIQILGEHFYCKRIEPIVADSDHQYSVPSHEIKEKRQKQKHQPTGKLKSIYKARVRKSSLKATMKHNVRPHICTSQEHKVDVEKFENIYQDETLNKGEIIRNISMDSLFVSNEVTIPFS